MLLLYLYWGLRGILHKFRLYFQYLMKQIIDSGNTALAHILIDSIGVFLQAHKHFLTQRFFIVPDGFNTPENPADVFGYIATKETYDRLQPYRQSFQRLALVRAILCIQFLLDFFDVFCQRPDKVGYILFVVHLLLLLGLSLSFSLSFSPQPLSFPPPPPPDDTLA